MLKNKLYYKKKENNHVIYNILGVKFKFKLKCRYKEDAIVFIAPLPIGDYMFCRPYFKYIRKSEKFKNQKFVLIVNDVYSDFVKLYDKEYFDEIIENKVNALLHNKYYRKYLLNNINKYKVTKLINLCCLNFGNGMDTNDLEGVILAKGIKAKEKYADTIFLDKYSNFKYKNIYTNILTNDNKKLFELERRRQFFEKLLEIPIPAENITLTHILSSSCSYISVSINTNGNHKFYSNDSWKGIIDYITSNTNHKILFLGAYDEIEKNNQLIRTLKHPEKCINLAGKTPISMLPELLRNSEFLLSVETGTVHIANALGCPVICLCNGAYYKRFQPYGNINYVYPREFIEKIKKGNIENFYFSNVYFNTSDILIEDVIEAIKKLLNGKIGVDTTFADTSNVWGGVIHKVFIPTEISAMAA